MPVPNQKSLPCGLRLNGLSVRCALEDGRSKCSDYLTLPATWVFWEANVLSAFFTGLFFALYNWLISYVILCNVGPLCTLCNRALRGQHSNSISTIVELGRSMSRLFGNNACAFVFVARLYFIGDRPSLVQNEALDHRSSHYFLLRNYGDKTHKLYSLVAMLYPWLSLTCLLPIDSIAYQSSLLTRERLHNFTGSQLKPISSRAQYPPCVHLA